VFANRLGTVLYLLAWPVLTILAAIGCYGLHLLTGPHDGPLYVIRGNPGIYLVIALFLGFVLCGPAGLLLFRLCVWRRYHEYMACGDQHFKFDIRRYMYVACVWLVPLAIDAAWHHAGAYTAFYPDGIADRSFWEVSARQYDWADVRAIYRVTTWAAEDAPNIGREPKYVVTFADGRRWASDEHMHAEQVGDDSMVALASEKTGKSVIPVATAKGL
jgi:hypothetical protein